MTSLTIPNRSVFLRVAEAIDIGLEMHFRLCAAIHPGSSHAHLSELRPRWFN